MSRSGDVHPLATFTATEPAGATSTSSSTRTDLPTVSPDQYTLEAEHARGGLGRIVLATDRTLQRPVAIKELIAAGPDGDGRFVREARLTARLQHPSIVPVYEAGRWPHGKPFYAMKFVRGRSLKQTIAERATLRERLALLPAVLATAEAIAYAHSKRIIHRDIKPSNVVLGAFGETVVVDWGLAKDLDAPEDAPPAAGPYRTRQSDATVAGAVLGTPAYMPPEQARGEIVDERADVYALGALLYHTLAGVAPHEGTTSDEVLLRVLAGAPPPLETRVDGVPADLAAIVAKAMARDRTQRYRDGAEFAADLERFQSGQLVAAYEYSSLARARRWVARHRALVAVSSASLAALALVVVLSVVRIVHERDVARSHGNAMVLASARAVLERDPAMALAWLKQYPLDGADWVSVRTTALDALGAGAARHVFRRVVPAVFGTFSRDGRRFVTQGSGTDVVVRDTVTGRVLMRRRFDVWPKEMAISGDGRVIVFTDDRGTGVHVWDVARDRDFAVGIGRGASRYLALRDDGALAATANDDGAVMLLDLQARTTRVIGRHEGGALWVAFSGDGALLASTGADGFVQRWRVASGELKRVLAHGGGGNTVAFSADGRRIVSCGADGSVQVWDPDEDRRVRLRAHDGSAEAAVLSPDGRLVASVGVDRRVRLWDWQGGATRVLEGHTDVVSAVAFDPSGRWLASGGRDETVRLWDVATGDVRVLRGHTGTVADLLFSSDGRWLASTDLDHSTRIWAVPAEVARTLSGHVGSIDDLQFAGNDRVLSAGDDGALREWDLTTGAARTLVAQRQKIYRFAVSPDGKRVVAATLGGGLHLWDEERGAARVLPSEPLTTFWDVSFSCDGRLIAAAAGDGTVRLVDTVTSLQRVVSGHGAGVADVDFGPGCGSIVSASSDGTVRLVDAATAVGRPFAKMASAVNVARFAPDGRRIATAATNGRVQLWGLDGKPLSAIDLPARSDEMIFSPSGRWLAAGSGDGTVDLWNLKSGAVRALIGHHGLVSRLSFSRDERLLATASHDHTVRLWDVASGAQLRAFRHGASVRALAFSPDGTRLASGGRDEKLRVWNATADAPAATDAAAVHAWLQQRTSAEIDRYESITSP